MLSYYQFMTWMEKMGEILGYKVITRQRGQDMLWVKGEKTYSFNFGQEGNEGRCAAQALDKGYEHIQLVLNNRTAEAVKGLNALFTHRVDLSVDCSLHELFEVVMPEKGTMIRRNALITRLRKYTGRVGCAYQIDKAVEAGLITRVVMSPKKVYYRRV